MTFNFLSPNVFKIIDSTASVILLGKFTPSESIKLTNILMGLHVVGNRSGTETLTLRLHTSENYSNVFTQSIFDFTDIPSNSSWIGRVNFLFDKMLSSGQDYWITVTAQNYTRNAFTDYLCLPFDRPQDVSSKTYGTLSSNIIPIPTTGWHYDYSLEFKPFGKK